MSYCCAETDDVTVFCKCFELFLFRIFKVSFSDFSSFVFDSRTCLSRKHISLASLGSHSLLISSNSKLVSKVKPAKSSPFLQASRCRVFFAVS